MLYLWADEGGGKEEIIRKRGRKTERKEGRTDERGDFGILPKHEHMNKHAPPLPRTLPPSGPTHTSLGLTNDRARERGREGARLTCPPSRRLPGRRPSVRPSLRRICDSSVRLSFLCSLVM